MSLTGIALLMAVFGPLVALTILRFGRTRLTAVPFYSIGTLLFACCAAAAIWLTRLNHEIVSVGNLMLVHPQGIDIQVEPVVEPFEPVLSPEPTIALVTPTLFEETPTRTPRPSPTRTPRSTPTSEPTATVEPTETETPEPTAAPTASRQIYQVQPGDTLRSIADDFGVTVGEIIEANGFTPEEADDLQAGDTIIIP